MSEKVNIRLEPAGKEFQVSSGTRLMDVVHQYGVEFPCGGKGTCGGCKVRLLTGDIHLTPDHREALQEIGLTEEWRLACLSSVESDVVLEVDQWEHIILADNTTFEFLPREGYGIAVDLGTTTIVSQLVDLSDGNVISVQRALNPQSRYGTDIMSRIEFGIRSQENEELLTALSREVVGQQIEDLLQQSDGTVSTIVIVGNTVMHHTFSGIDLKPLSAYPFHSADSGAQTFHPFDLELDLPGEPRITFLPCIGGFVGSDILAGIMAARMHRSDEWIALIDLGTNGEIAIGSKERILCASTAAGPAFEGMNISMGMSATTGAISSVSVEEGKLRCHVIGDERPRGICGSGLIDAVAVLLQEGRINNRGRFTGSSDTIELLSPVYLSRRDIGEFQLAKGAIATGMQILMDQLGPDHVDLRQVYIAGAFGHYLNPHNIRQIGMLQHDPDKIQKLGNSALIGAKMSLFQEFDTINEILEKTEHISLESEPDFQHIFTEKMLF